MTQEAAVQSNFEMEQALGPYVDAVSVEASKWARCVIAFALRCVCACACACACLCCSVLQCVC